MICEIKFQNVLPKVFEDSPLGGEPSEVWDCDLSFQKGKSYLIEAASGRGKSSFCSFVLGLRNDYRGKITLIGDNHQPLERTPQLGDKLRQEGIAMMFQEHRLFPELTALENVMLKSQLTHHTDEAKVKDLLIQLGLDDRINTPCGRMSFGQQQRVAFVRMLCQPADFLLLDEPVSHLDLQNATIMSHLLQAHQQATGAGVIVTSIGHRLPYTYDSVIKL